MSFSRDVWTVARTEALMVRRTARFWIFSTLALVVALAFHTYYAGMHHYFSGEAATVAALNPRWFSVALALYFCAMITLAVVFLAFDFHGKDQAARLSAVLHARPLSTAALVLGKFLGVALPVYVVGLVTFALLALLNVIWGVGNHVPALLTTLVLQLVPAIAFTAALSFLVAAVLRLRALAAIVVLGLLAAYFTSFAYVSVGTLMAYDFTGFLAVPVPSDMLGLQPWLPALVQRSGILLFAVGLLGLVVLVHPRPPAEARRPVALLTLVGLVAGALLLAWLPSRHHAAMRRRAALVAEQRALADRPALAVSAYELDIDVEPSAGVLRGHARLKVSNPGTEALHELLFTLNPGLRVDSVSGPGGQPLAFVRGQGLLTVTWPGGLAPASAGQLEVRYAGHIDAAAVFADAPVDIDSVTQAGSSYMLGKQTVLLTARGGVLLPEARWYPSPNADFGSTQGGSGASRLATADITLRVPSELVAVTQGLPEPVRTEGGRSVQRFREPVPVPGLTLVLGRYEVREVTIEGVRCALYFDRQHRAAVDFFADALPAVTSHVGERLREARRVGLPYPYARLVVAEVPVGLRSFGGGWRLAATGAQPGMLLVRENLFFTGNFGPTFERRRAQQQQRAGSVDVPALKLTLLQQFFRFDVLGGNLIDNFAPQLWAFQTPARGRLAPVLQTALERQVAELALGTSGYFSPFLFEDEERMWAALIQSWQERGAEQDMPDFTDGLIQSMTGDDTVYRTLQGQPLGSLDPYADPKLYARVLERKAVPFGRALRALLGDERFRQLLWRLRDDHAAGGYDEHDLRRVAEALHGADLGAFFEQWLERTELPGFELLEARVTRLAGREGELARHQVTFVVQNPEAVAGQARLRLITEQGTLERLLDVAAHTRLRVGLISEAQPRRLVLEPFLSLNRGPVVRELGAPSADSAAAPFDGQTPEPFVAEDPRRVVVDDLDPEFSVTAEARRGLRLGTGAASGSELASWGGYDRVPASWARLANLSAHGRYRAVLTFRAQGEGRSPAQWSARLPQAGRWRVWVHLPDRERLPARLRDLFPQAALEGARYSYALETADGPAEASVALKGLEPGWTELGTWRFERQATLRLSDRSKVPLLADAVRFDAVDLPAALDEVAQ
jgi:ABC-type transport system involved in multi-copper enzyme maturation permease subunit